MRGRSGLLLCFLLTACAYDPANVPVGDRSSQPVRIPATHTVGQSDTLYSVAFLYGLTVDKLSAWNNIRAPYTIYRGQKIRLSAPPAKPPPAVVRKAPPPSKPKVSVQSRSRPALPRDVRPSQPKVDASHGTPKKIAVPASAPAASSGPPTWTWPADGTLSDRFDGRSTGKKGINIAGKPGNPVRAAADGKIVYAGSGLSGYGRLIIIKHNKDFLSAYAHNRKLIAREGQWVKKGELIAHMGRSATDRTELHFEIRKNGRPVDPLKYLPKR